MRYILKRIKNTYANFKMICKSTQIADLQNEQFMARMTGYQTVLFIYYISLIIRRWRQKKIELYQKK